MRAPYKIETDSNGMITGIVDLPPPKASQWITPPPWWAEKGYLDTLPLSAVEYIPLDTLDRRQEKLALIRHLRDTTDSRDIHQRCVAIVGERS